MKKFLLPLLALSIGGYCLATDIDTSICRSVAPRDTQTSAPKKKIESESEQDNTYSFKFCGPVAKWYPYAHEAEMHQFISVPAEVATMLAGNKITGIGYSISFDNDATLETTIPGYICIWEEGKLVLKKEVQMYDSYLREERCQQSEFDEDNQYVIKENTPFAFGIAFMNKREYFTVSVDAKEPTYFAGKLESYSEDGEFIGGIDAQQGLGNNIFLYANTVGEKSGVNDFFTIGSASIGDFMLPIFKENNFLPVNVYIKNNGENSLSTLDYVYDFGDNEKKEGQAKINIAPNKEKWVDINITDYPKGRGEINLSITKVNDRAVDKSLSNQYINLGNSEGFNRKFVVEEGTGTWCGWCPRGIVGMEYMTETYPDTFIGIAVHAGDDFTVESYAPFIEKFYDIYPTCVINRDSTFVIDPSIEFLEMAYQYWSGHVSPVSLDLNVETSSNDVADGCFKANGKVKFAIDEKNADYRLSFVVLEDGLIGSQSNYYAEMSGMECNGWEDLKNPQLWEYAHTARNIYDTFGITGILPAEAIEADKEYEYAYEIPYDNIEDLKNTSIVALVIDGKTGTVLNAEKVESKDYINFDGIADGMIDNNDSQDVYYNLQGIKVTHPQYGKAYIKVNGNKATKIIK